MAANNTAAPEKERNGISIPPAVIVIALVLIAGTGAFLYLNRAAEKPPQPPAALTGDARTYVHNGFLPIKDVDMQAHESYLKQQVVEITGKIQNTGNRVVSRADLLRLPGLIRPGGAARTGGDRQAEAASRRHAELPPGLRQHSGELEPGHAHHRDRVNRVRVKPERSAIA